MRYVATFESFLISSPKPPTTVYSPLPASKHGSTEDGEDDGVGQTSVSCGMPASRKKVSTFKHSKSKERSDVEGLEEGGDAHLCKTTTLISLPAMFLVCVFMTCCEFEEEKEHLQKKSTSFLSQLFLLVFRLRRDVYLLCASLVPRGSSLSAAARK